MSLKSSVFIATSLDGFIAREDGNLDWLDAANAILPNGEDCGFNSSESPKELHDRLSNEGLKRIYVDGGITIQRFIDADLIDDITITLIPVVLGNGKPLFATKCRDIPLKLISTKTYDFGFVQLTYNIEKNA